ncbi:MarR family transcriptional regulator [Gammaproteobacteria bacterium]|nr:MarR family transcriptional regulator [Gammaproteobacteria bacterium]MDA7844027.1 MarR family transcriptional regulator [Gammaproteobacteria bacterium]MDA9102328.1 MarR family transcriptional regulator [Gammaproteobacteria bacterium]
MSKQFVAELAEILKLLSNIEEQYNLVAFNQTEKKIYYTIATNLADASKCNITDLINSSGFSRSTIYKTLKKFEKQGLIKMQQSFGDKREFNLDLITA